MNTYYFNSPAWTLAKDQNNELIISGDFTLVNPSERKGLAAISLSKKQLLDWNPMLGNVTPNINAMAIKGSVIYVGGDFTRVGSDEDTTLQQ